MEKKRNPFDSKVVHYLRPNQPFQCGRPGDPCEMGPTTSGRCSSPDGRCNPVPGEGKTRQRFFRAATLLTLGIVLVVLSGNDFTSLDPGTHSSFHSHLDCASCHDQIDLISVDFLRRGILSQGEPHASMKCLDCHVMGEHGAKPHSIAPEYLSLLTEGLSDSGRPIENVACARCHEEHRPQESTRSIHDTRCQSCHQQQFPSFDDGHPEFSSTYGQPKRAIQFDHGDHARKHFSEYPDLAPESCDDCHILAPDRHRMMVQPFAISCAPCHADSISGHGPTGKNRGIEFLSLPSLDSETLSQTGRDIGAWPRVGSDFPRGWSLRWIREGMSEDTDLEILSGVELYDLENQPDEVLAATQKLALQFKNQLRKALDSDLEIFIRSLVSPAEEMDVDRVQISRLSGKLPRSLLEQARTSWFPPPEEESVISSESSTEDDSMRDENDDDDEDLLVDDDDDDLLTDDDDDLLLDESHPADLATTDRDESSITRSGGTISAIDPDKWANAGGWYFDAPSIRYRPVEHADRFIQEWATMEAKIGGKDPDSKSIFQQVFGPLAAGNCATCHIGVQLDEPKVLWSPSSMRPPSYPQATHFSHGPHVLSGSSATCLSCHEIASDPQLSNDWKSISRNTCTECHGQQIQSGCTTCHEYHVGPRSRLLNSARIEQLNLPRKK